MAQFAPTKQNATHRCLMINVFVASVPSTAALKFACGFIGWESFHLADVAPLAL